MNLGNDGNGMPLKKNCRRRANPPKNVSGSAGTKLSYELSEKCAKTGSGSCRTVTSSLSTGPRMSWMSTLDMRSRHSSAAMMFSTPFLVTDGYEGSTNKMIGKGGQIFSDLPVGVLPVQTSRRSRRRGDPNTTCRHRRHTCVSVFHLHVK